MGGPGESHGRKRSRWGGDTKSYVPGGLAIIPTALSREQKEALVTRITLDEINRKLNHPNFEINPDDPRRSPSPEPTYDRDGKRTNTREVRVKDKLLKDRHRHIVHAQQLNPNYVPPSDYRPLSDKKSMKLYIPVKDWPDYNFIGLIIGPRGNTQKRMERESGAKIAIRGKGSVKEGKGRKDGKAQMGEDDDLHVLITADTMEMCQHAAELVQPLLEPVEEGQNEHKRQQLRELAAINGTLRDDDYCANCGQVGHRHWQCPERSGASWKPADVCCALCGEKSHVTSDCPQKGRPVPAMSEEKKKMDAEYESFLQQLSGGPPPPGGNAPPPPPGADNMENSMPPPPAGDNAPYMHHPPGPPGYGHGGPGNYGHGHNAPWNQQGPPPPGPMGGPPPPWGAPPPGQGYPPGPPGPYGGPPPPQSAAPWQQPPMGGMPPPPPPQ
eukprot:GFYU01007011.1.p1 GENE.GFYU01007011.1~~GFYU01007011.1.p1  ORF type:complete len:440 (+),score=60.70 GFYU01007011.1:143-1462(+)